MVKRIFILLGLAYGYLCVNAAVSYMVVEQKDGQIFSFLLEDKPVITYKSGNLVVNDDATTSYEISGVKNYHFSEGIGTKAEKVGADVVRISALDGGAIRVENAKEGVLVTIVNVAGLLVSEKTVEEDGSVEVTLPAQKGVYILSVGAQSFKVFRK